MGWGRLPSNRGFDGYPAIAGLVARSHGASKAVEREKAKPSGNGRAEPAEVPDDRKSAWGEAALEAIAAELTAAQKGELHNTANLCGFRAGQLRGRRLSIKGRGLRASRRPLPWQETSRPATGRWGLTARSCCHRKMGRRSPRRPGDKDDIGGVVINLGERKRREEWGAKSRAGSKSMVPAW